MKKLWKKFKCWLIKKLGGYLEETHVVEHYTVRPVYVESQLNGVDLNRYLEDSDFKKYIDTMLIGRLSDKLYDDQEQLVRVVESVPNNEFAVSTISLRAMIKVYPNS